MGSFRFVEGHDFVMFFFRGEFISSRLLGGERMDDLQVLCWEGVVTGSELLVTKTRVSGFDRIHS